MENNEYDLLLNEVVKIWNKTNPDSKLKLTEEKGNTDNDKYFHVFALEKDGKTFISNKITGEHVYEDIKRSSAFFKQASAKAMLLSLATTGLMKYQDNGEE